MKNKTKFRLSPLAVFLTVLGYLLFFIVWEYFYDTGKITVSKEIANPFLVLLTRSWTSSRLWDIVMFPAFILIGIKLVKYLGKPKHKVEELYLGALLNLFLWSIFGIWVLIKGEIGISIEFYFWSCLMINFGFSLIVGIVKGFNLSLKLSIISCLTASLILGLIIGLKIGFASSLIIGLKMFAGMTLIVGAGAVLGCFKKYFTLETFNRARSHFRINFFRRIL